MSDDQVQEPRVSEPGWYRDAQDGDRYWTGTEWVPRVQVVEPEPRGGTPDGYLGVGLVLVAVGVILFAYDGLDSDLDAPRVLGLILAGLGWVLLGVGMVAKGVQVGRRHP